MTEPRGLSEGDSRVSRGAGVVRVKDRSAYRTRQGRSPSAHYFSLHCEVSGRVTAAHAHVASPTNCKIQVL